MGTCARVGGVLALVLAACSTPAARPVATVVPATPPIAAPAPAPVAPRTAAEVLAAMASAYSNATAYVDEGEVVTEYSGTGRRHTQRLKFRTAFIRGGRFLFEFHGVGSAYGLGAAIWTDDPHVYYQHRASPSVTDERSLDYAVAGATGISGGAAHTVPRMLLPLDVLGWSLPELENARLDGSEVIDDHDCWRIEGSAVQGAAVTAWVDRDTYLLRRIVETIHFDATATRGAFDTEQTTTYRPRLEEPTDHDLKGPDLAAVTVTPPDGHVWIAVRLDEGRHVTRVEKAGPGEAAGIRIGDEILAVDGTAIQTSTDLYREIDRSQVGSTRTIRLRRNGQEMTVTVTPVPVL